MFKILCYVAIKSTISVKNYLQERIEDGEDVEMQIDSDAEDETQIRGEGEKGDRAKDNNQVSIFRYALYIIFIRFEYLYCNTI